MTTSTPNESRRTVVLSGPPGVGKTSVASVVAARLGCPALDLDALVEDRAGRSPARIIEGDGEPRFRELEAQTLEDLEAKPRVLALGGGTLTTPRARRAARRLGPVFGLRASRAQLGARLSKATAPRRPLLASGLERLLDDRAQSYCAVDARVDAEGALDSVAMELADRAEAMTQIEAQVGDDRSRIVVGRDLTDAPAGALAHLEPQRPVLVIVDAGVPEAMREARLAPVRALFETHEVVVPGGEPVKAWSVAGEILEDALAAGCGRQSAVLGLGGGATCDLAGFVAHLLGRGAPLVLVPSTLLAQVDASVGGKCAVNMDAGRNLVGAFHAAHDVIVDVALLDSLEPEDYRSGLAELVKIAIIADAELFERVVAAGRADAETIARAIALKAAIVAEDPFEADLRRVLNLGHTLGHALETASEYTLRHGEAVAIGIAAMARDGAESGIATCETAERVILGLKALGLPTSADPDLLRRAAEHIGADKKSAAGMVALICIHEVARVSVQALPLSEAKMRLVRHGGQR